MKPLRRKLVMLILSFLLLAAAVIYATNAWYTKMVSVADMEFEVARWDFAANQQLDDMVLNIYEYSTLHDQLVAPGTAGYIPIQLTALESDTDVNYYITVDKSPMSEEFKKRIRIYYKDGTGEHDFHNDGNDLSGVLIKGTETTVIIYWEWIYELNTDENGNPLTAEQILANNEFDTEVGKNPELYVKDMNAIISIAGAQVKPSPSPSVTPTSGP
jgi:hypothetical protein